MSHWVTDAYKAHGSASPLGVCAASTREMASSLAQFKGSSLIYLCCGRSSLRTLIWRWGGHLASVSGLFEHNAVLDLSESLTMKWKALRYTVPLSHAASAAVRLLQELLHNGSF